MQSSKRPTGLAVFATQSSAEIGGGHLVRCSSLASGLLERGWDVNFVLGKDSSVPIELSHPVEFVEEGTQPERLAELWPAGCDLLIVDHYGRSESFESACRPWARRIMVIDDLADRKHDADLLLDQNLGRKKEDYRVLVPPHCQVLVGPRFAFLRSGFSVSRRAVLERRKGVQAPKRIFIGMGATDPANVTEIALAAVESVAAELSVDVVLGRTALHLERVRQAIGKMATPVELHVGTDSVVDLMGRADLAIGAGGGSSWERCCLGLPAIVVKSDHDNEPAIDHLKTCGAIALVAPEKEASAGDVASEIIALLKNRDALREMGRRAAAVCDGKGVPRTLPKIESLCGFHETPKEQMVAS